jgi:C-lobe and N-lobe beta barrels of Tf-binding protein B
MRHINIWALTVASLMVTACGGAGGGVGSTPTPPPAPTSPPPPPPPPNTSLINLTSSETFVNDGASGTANFPKNGSSQTATAAAATVSIAYDLPTKGYTITAGGRTQTFLPADIDNAQSNAGVTVFMKRNGTTTDTLTLTKPGTSGRFTYEFVGGGYWQRTVDGVSAVSGSFDAFAYGITTPNAAVPRTGTALYSIDLLAAETVPSNVVGLSGQGKLAIDLASGRIVLRGTIDNPVAFQASAFSALASLSSSANAFSGTITLSGQGVPDYSGSLNGRLFGPVGQEVGAAFGATNSQGNAIAGSIIGRKASSGGNTDITALMTDDFLKGDAARLGFDGSSTVPVAVKENGVGVISVYYNSAGSTYDLFLNGRTALIRNRDFLANSLNNSFYAGLSLQETYSFFATPTLKYLRTGRSYAANGVRYTLDDLVFGLATPDASLQRSGEGGYSVRLVGSIAETGASDIQTVQGTGTLTANFATGAIKTNGSVTTYFGQPTAIGSFDGTATISSTTNQFAGTLAFSGGAAYSGNLNGRFYGPAAAEVGAAFSLTGPNGSVATGTITGANDPTVLAARQGLLELTQKTDLNSTGIFVTNPIPFASHPDIVVTYDPVAKSYDFVSKATINLVAPPIAAALAETDRSAAKSNAVFTAYEKAAAPGPISARLFNPGSTNPKLALTYVSFADLTVTNTANTTTTRYFVPFGVVTPLSQFPRSGSAVYNGVAYAAGRVDAVASMDAAVDGTSRFDVNFGTGSVVTMLTLSARNPLTQATASLGNFLFNGQLGSASPGGGGTRFLGQSGDTSFIGNLQGDFYGANAAEIGAIFGLNKQDLLTPGSPAILIQGVAVAKKGP